MEQHKPSQRARLITDDEMSFGQQEVIIQQPGEAFLTSSESNQSFAVSMGLRAVSLGFSSFFAWLFLSHYKLSSGGSGLDMLHPVANQIFLAFMFFFLIGGMVQRAMKDRNTPVSELQANIGKVFWRPILSYLGWTFLFFILPFLGHGGLTLAFAAIVIGTKGLGLRLTSGGGFRPMGFSGFNFTTYKFKR